MAVRDGRILGLGSRDDVFRHHTSRTRLIDLAGRTLMPGFIDPHVHLGWSAFTQYCWLQVAPPTVTTRTELLDVLRIAASGRRADECITSCGNEPKNQSTAGPALKAADLDEVSRPNPILVMQKYGDVFYVNHRAFEVAGIDIRSPYDSAFARDVEGRVTGRLRGG